MEPTRTRIDEILDIHSRQLESLTKREAEDFLKTYRSSSRELLASLREGLTDDQAQRTRVALAQVEAGTQQLERRLRVKLDASTRLASEKALADLLGVIKKAEPEMGEVGGLMETRALQRMVGQDALALHRYSLARYGREIVERLQREIVASTTGNETIDAMEKRLRGVLKGQEHRAWLIARMETSRAYNDAHLASITEAGEHLPGMMKRIHEATDRRNHPFSRASHGETAKVDEPFQVSVSAVLAAGKAMGKGTGGILWKRVGANWEGMNLPAHFGERGRVVPHRKAWETEEAVVVPPPVVKPKPPVVKPPPPVVVKPKAVKKAPRKRVAKPKGPTPAEVRAKAFEAAQAELVKAETDALALGLNPHRYEYGWEGMVETNKRTSMANMVEFAAERKMGVATSGQEALDVLDAVTVAYRKAARVAPRAWEAAERVKWRDALITNLPRSDKAGVVAKIGEALDFYPVDHLRLLATDGTKIIHDAANARAFAYGARREVHMDLREMVTGEWLAADTMAHEVGHVLDAIMGAEMRHTVQKAGQPWKARPGYEDASKAWAKAYGDPFEKAKTGGVQILPGETGDVGRHMWSGNWANQYDARIYTHGMPDADELTTSGPVEFLAMSNGRRKGQQGIWTETIQEHQGRPLGLDGRSKIRGAENSVDGVTAGLVHELGGPVSDSVTMRNLVYGTKHRDAIEELYGDGQRFARSLADRTDLEWKGDGDVHATALLIRHQFGTPMEKLLGPGGELAGKLAKPWDGKGWAAELVPEHGTPIRAKSEWAHLIADMVRDKVDIR